MAINSNVRTYSGGYGVSEARASFKRRVYTWMTGGILLTAMVSTYLGANPELIIELLQNKMLYYGLLIAQIGAVMTLSFALTKLSPGAVMALFVGYAGLTGVTLSTIFLMYTHESIAGVFLSTACGFAGLSILGYTTKRDLGPVGAFCGMALFGLVGWGLLSMFFPSLMGGSAGSMYSILGVVVFAGLTAYDTQKIKEMSVAGQMNGAGGVEMESKAAVYGALMLYLDFINLFISLLRLMGDRRR